MAKRSSAALAEAEQFFRKAIDRDPEFALAYVGLADALILRIGYSGAARDSSRINAEKAVARALELDPSLAEAWASSGLIAHEQGQYVRAESMLRRAIELNPNYAAARNWYSSALRAVGRLKESLPQMQRAEELDPFSALFKQNLGGMLEDKGRFHEAAAAYQRAITIDPSRPTPYMALASLNAHALNRFADAVPLARKAMELDPGSPGPYGALAGLYFDLGDDNRFFEISDRAVRRWPEDINVQFGMAVVSVFRSDAAAMVRHAQRTLDEYPQHYWAMALLRNADLQNRRYDAALARYEKAYPDFFMPGAPRIHEANTAPAIDLALVLQRLGDDQRAGALLDAVAGVTRTLPRLGFSGYGIEDVQMHTLRGEKARALAALRLAERAGWRRWWRYYRDFDPSLESIRDEPEFKSVFADIERDMARQRAALAARPKDAAPERAPVR